MQVPASARNEGPSGSITRDSPTLGLSEGCVGCPDHPPLCGHALRLSFRRPWAERRLPSSYLFKQRLSRRLYGVNSRELGYTIHPVCDVLSELLAIVVTEHQLGAKYLKSFPEPYDRYCLCGSVPPRVTVSLKGRGWDLNCGLRRLTVGLSRQQREANKPSGPWGPSDSEQTGPPVCPFLLTQPG